MRSSLIVGALAFVLGGCDMRMSEEMGQMQSELDRLGDETTTHAAAIDGANDLPSVEREMVRHDGETGPIVEDLDETIDHMSRHCYDQDLGGMRARHGELDGELAHHDAAMSGATDLDVARREVDRHGRAVTSISDGMETAMQAMSCR